MKSNSLYRSIIFSFFAVITLLGVSVFLLGYYIIYSQVIQRAQARVGSDLHTAHAVLRQEIETIDKSFSLVGMMGNIAELKDKLGLDYIYVVNRESKDSLPSEIVHEAFKGNMVTWKRIIREPELKKMNEMLFEKAVIPIKPTPKARPTDRTLLTSALAIECAKPFFDSAGRVTSVLYGGRIINRQYPLVDRIRDIVYENKLYKSKPVGTVTIFLDDVRIATNVLDDKGRRAIGTRVSDVVYANVVEHGREWHSRAFVVTDWYLTGYEPIKSLSGEVIGILYVGVLEKPFDDMKRNMLLALLAIIGLSVMLAGGLSLALARNVSKPLTSLLKATTRISAGNFDHQKEKGTKLREISQLQDSFESMAKALKERDESLRISSEKLESLNKTYLDLVTMVSHELKGILATTILNAYSLRDEVFGAVNEKQKKALNSITRSLDYLDVTVKNFLNLSRIEKNELSLHIQQLKFREDVVAASIEAFSRGALERSMTIICEIPDGMVINGDVSLLQIVMNNLLSNAVKYGFEGGKICIRSSECPDPEKIGIEVYNDGRPFTDAETERLFKRFSRLDTYESHRVHGTGVGLFITCQIIQKHEGAIRVETSPSGNSFVFTLARNPRKGN